MNNDGYSDILNIDISPVLIERMRTSCKNMQWEVMDVRKMEKILSSSIGIVLDKGTLDVFLCNEKSVWDASEEAQSNIKQYMDEIFRVLRVNGKFIYITFGQPHFRRKFFDAYGRIEQHEIGDGFKYFVYIVTKEC